MKTFSKVTLLLLATALVVGACGRVSTVPTPVDGRTLAGLSAVGDIVGLPDPTGSLPAFVTAVGERFIICKTGPDAQFNVTVNGGPAPGSPFTVRDGECKVVYEDGGASDIVTSTEVVPTGAQLDDIQVTQLLCGHANAGCGGAVVINGPTSVTDPASGVVAGTLGGSNPHGVAGTVAHYFNSLTQTPLEGRFTGGGFQMISNGVEVKVTRGFTVHCHNLLTNNLEVNWGGNAFHMDKNSLSNVTCTFVQDPTPPRAPVSRIVASSTGRCNGGPATIDFVLEDRGEPGRNDRSALRISGACSLDVAEDFLDRGNIQAHFDQPHRK